MRQKTILLIVGFLAVVGVAFASIRDYRANQVGSVTVSYLAAIPNSAITFDGVSPQPVTTSTQSVTYKLRHGLHNLTINLAGYKPFGVQFSLKTGETVTINANLTLKSDPTIHSSQQIKGLGSQPLVITNLKYYYGQTWAVFKVQASGIDPAVVAAQYDPASAQWQTKLGPGTFFEPDDVSGLPSLVQEYFEANGYIDQGGSQ